MTEQPAQLSTGRMRHDDIVKAIAFALRHLEAVDEYLEDSPLVRTPLIRRRSGHSQLLFARGGALRDELLEIVGLLLERLPSPGTERIRRIRGTLAGVVLEGRSIADIAREHGRLRESWSRGPWRAAVKIVAAEFIRRNADAGPTRPEEGR